MTDQMPDLVPESKRAHSLTLTSEQQAAFELMHRFAKNPWASSICIHGLAGCGKTTLLTEFARTAGFAYLWLATLTGKAASVLRRKSGLPATTVHSVLYQTRVLTDAQGRRNFEFSEVHDPGALSFKLVLLDECGQIGEELMADLLRTGCHVIATGDPGQLGPVKQNQYFTHCDFELTEIHRQAWDSPIIRQAHAVRRGLDYETDGDAFRVITRVCDEDILGADVMLTWTRRRRDALNHQARALRGLWGTPAVGEPVMCQRNFKRKGLFNGAIYPLVNPFGQGDTSITIDVDGEEVTVPNVKFDGVENQLIDEEVNTSFRFGYACTVHSAAGSEWDNVLLFDDYRPIEDRDRWRYTAITRAARTITVVQS